MKRFKYGEELCSNITLSEAVVCAYWHLPSANPLKDNTKIQLSYSDHHQHQKDLLPTKLF